MVICSEIEILINLLCDSKKSKLEVTVIGKPDSWQTHGRDNLWYKDGLGQL